MNTSHTAAILEHFQALWIPLSPTWLAALLHHLPPLPLAELKTRVAQYFSDSDVCSSLAPARVIPVISGETTIVLQNVIVQVLGVQEIGSSLAQQLDALEVLQESRKPLERRLIRTEQVLDQQDDHDDDVEQHDQGAGGRVTTITHFNDSSSRRTIHAPGEFLESSTQVETNEAVGYKKKMLKLVLEDSAGHSIYGIEQVPVPQFRTDMPLGAKLLLVNVPLVHGVAILSPAKIEWIGGCHGASKVAHDVASMKQDLFARWSALPIMTTRERTNVETRQEEEEEGYDDNDAQEWDVPHQQQTARGRQGNQPYARQNGATLFRGGRGTRSRGTRGGAGRGTRTRGRATTTSYRARGRGH